MKDKITLKDQTNEYNSLEITLRQAIHDNSLSFSCEKYKGAIDNEFAHIEFYDGKLRIAVWANPEEEDATHHLVIPLEEDQKEINLDQQRLGYDDATCGNECQSQDPSYLIGYREGLKSKIAWAQEELDRFISKNSK